jgi:RNA polymerase sigma factor (sigma-70 family)
MPFGAEFMKQLRIEIRGKNNRLWKLVHTNFKTESLCAGAIRISQQSLNGFINFRSSPWNGPKTQLSNNAKTIAAFFEKEPAWLFPPELYENNKKKLAIIEADRFDFVKLDHSEVKNLLSFDSPEKDVMASLLKNEVAGAIETLTDSEKNIIDMRFGLTTAYPLTLAETGRHLGVTTERVRQIQAKAIRKLRHPSRSKSMRDYL